MASQFLDLIESISAAEADIHRLFGRENGISVRRGQRWPDYDKHFADAAKFVGQVFDGHRPMWQLKEALSTSDFPYLFGDTIDRLLLAKFQTITPMWQQYLKLGVVKDFRTAKRFRCSRGAGILDELGEGNSYKTDAPTESYYSFAVKVYGRRRNILWQALVNDDLDALRSAPDDLAYQAANTEAYIASSQYVANSTLYAASGGGRPTNGNKGNAILDVTNLEAAVAQMALFTDDQGYPFKNAPKYLVVPPALELTALKILRSIQLTYTGSADKSQPVLNVLQGMLTPIVDYYIPILDTTNGNTSWYLFADPNDGWAAEVAFLQGHESPEMFMKSPNQVLLGGGAANPMDGDFDNDAVGYKVRHVIGGSHANSVGGWRFSYWSDGTMS